MASPVDVPTPVDVWTLVAAGALNGNIYPRIPESKYRVTHVMNGDAAPTAKDIGLEISAGGFAIITTNGVDSIDAYMWSTGVAGSVRVSI